MDGNEHSTQAAKAYEAGYSDGQNQAVYDIGYKAGYSSARARHEGDTELFNSGREQIEKSLRTRKICTIVSIIAAVGSVLCTLCVILNSLFFR